jgi:hypothetical protein
MATGDQADITQRLYAVLPPAWFPSGATPVLGAILQGPAYVLSLIYGLVGFTKLQTRISTATGGWLDLISYDFFARALLRLTGETDSAFSARIRANLLRPAATRPSLIVAVTDLTGETPTVIDPWRPGDCGAYGYGGLGYNTIGYYGSLAMVAQCFVMVPDPASSNVSDAEIYQEISSIIPAGVTAWTEITS